MGTLPCTARYSGDQFRGPKMNWTFLPLVFVVASASAQTINYEWLNEPCVSLLNCDTGCTACNSSRNSNSQFTGTDVGWIGVDVCPHPAIVGDNALFTYGWPSIADEDHMMLVSGIAFSPIHIDSLVFRHRSAPDGPQRLRVRFGVNESMSADEVGDVPVPSAFGNTVLTDLGDVAAGDGMLYGFFSLLLQPYLGEGGPWELDELRIVGTAISTTAVPDLSLPARMGKLPRYDALGRPIIDRPGVRFYLDGTKHVVLR
jgi:hypothetical protein